MQAEIYYTGNGARGPRWIGLIILAALCAAPAFSQSPLVITNIYNRPSISLNGKWQVIPNPYGPRTGKRPYWKNLKPADPSQLVEYDFNASPQLSVPGDWNSQDDKFFWYEGTLWYQRDFRYAAQAGRRQFLYFSAANYFADVYLNAAKIGEHSGGFTPFCFEVTGKLKAENFLTVAVDNRREPDDVPGLETDWWNYGGLTRDVLLVEEPATFIADYSLSLKKTSHNQISGWVRLNGPQSKQPVTIQIPELKLAKTFTADETGNAPVAFSAKVSLWSPENPKLYKVIIASATDTVSDSIGFRTIEAKGTKILLNGQPVFLRGICIHEEAPLRAGRAWTPEDAQILLGWAKELNANFVRLAHYPHNEHMVRAADRLGLIVWAEIPVYWGIAWENPVSLERSRQQLAEMITRDRNRACVGLWSVANETPNTGPRLQFLRNLIDYAHQLDSTRLVAAALLAPPESLVMNLNDPLGQYLDVLGCNEYIGWYGRRMPEFTDSVTWKSAYEKPLIMSELGAEAVVGRRGGLHERWAEDYQMNFYRHHLAMLERIPFLAGVSPWILKDFRSPRRAHPQFQEFYNRKGLVSERGDRKQAFYLLRDFYREKAAARP